MSATRVEAILINYFGAGLTRRCVRSLRGQGLDVLHLVDNSADDDERRAVADLADEVRGWPEAPCVELHLNARNLGFACGVNRVVAADRAGERPADFYLLLNNDLELSPGVVRRLLDAALRDPGAALVSPMVDWGGSERCRLWYGRLSGHQSENRFPGAFSYLSGCCLLVDGRLAGDSGLLDPRFFMYGEDVALAWRARRLGLRSVCETSARVRHAGSASSGVGSLFYEYQVARGHWLLASVLARSVFEYPLLALGRVAYLALRALLRAVRFRSPVPLIALVRLAAGAAPGPPRRARAR